MSEFEGFGPKVQKWFQGLEADNSRDYFAANRDFYERSVRDQMDALLAELSQEFGNEVKLFRQNRDIRFSSDKSPYKTNTYGIVRGSGVPAGGFYASISASGLVAGTGYHQMARDQLARFRDAVVDDRSGPPLVGLVDDAQRAGLELWGETLATTPRGYPKEHERIALLRRRSLTLGARRPFRRGISRAEGLQFVAATWRAAAPVTAWLDEHVGASALPVDRVRRRR